jgi:hypothetical protein
VLGISNAGVNSIIGINIGAPTGANTVGVNYAPQYTNAQTGNPSGFVTRPSFSAVSSLTTLNHYTAAQGTFTAGAALSNQQGFVADATMVSATSFNAGFVGALPSGANNYNLYMSGTAVNVLAGQTSIGGLVGAEGLRVVPVGSAVNYLQVVGAIAGGSPTISAQGTNADIDITATPKGAGNFKTNSAYSPNLTLTDAATIAWNTSAAGGQVATFTFVATNRTMGAPTNLKNGGFYALAVIQNAGSNTLTWNAVFKWAAGTAPTLSTAAGAKDYFTFRSDGTNLYQQGISQAVA